jgi:hypothetical protein
MFEKCAGPRRCSSAAPACRHPLYPDRTHASLDRRSRGWWCFRHAFVWMGFAAFPKRDIGDAILKLATALGA